MAGMVIAEPLEQIPHWAWDLLVGVLDHEDEHTKDDRCCLDGLLAQVPDHVRAAAQGVRAYLRSNPPPPTRAPG